MAGLNFTGGVGGMPITGGLGGGGGQPMQPFQFQFPTLAPRRFSLQRPEADRAALAARGLDPKSINGGMTGLEADYIQPTFSPPPPGTTPASWGNNFNAWAPGARVGPSFGQPVQPPLTMRAASTPRMAPAPPLFLPPALPALTAPSGKPQAITPPAPPDPFAGLPTPVGVGINDEAQRATWMARRFGPSSPNYLQHLPFPGYGGRM